MPLNPYANEWTPSQNIAISPSPPHESQPKNARKQRTRRKNHEGGVKKYNKVQEGSSSKPTLSEKEKKSYAADDFPSLTTHTKSDVNETSRHERPPPAAVLPPAPPPYLSKCPLTYLELTQKQLIQPLVNPESVDTEPVGWFSSRSCRKWNHISLSPPAVDSSSDEDDGLTSLECTALIPEQQIASPSMPTVCQTSANESAVAR